MVIDLSKEWSILEIAKITHEVNSVYCRAIGEDPPPWESLPVPIRMSVFDGVSEAVSNPNWGPEQMHNRWVWYRINDGWTYGPEQSLENRTHPLLVPWEQVPTLQRAKDAIFLAVVHGLWEATRDQAIPAVAPVAREGKEEQDGQGSHHPA